MASREDYTNLDLMQRQGNFYSQTGAQKELMSALNEIDQLRQALAMNRQVDSARSKQVKA